ncbi:DUF302 domain-containing protein [Undibacterium sp. TJN25]|uniref:DUF302 domain-containing protein n=1 Tax=Undibacterium sp. TJN25 TaxID=3413056 RepID=UPI003BF01C92
MTQKTSKSLTIQHMTITSNRAFAIVRQALEEVLPTLDTTIIDSLRKGDQARAQEYDDKGPRLSIFGERNHGALLEIVGLPRYAIQYEIGNPLTASKMTRHQLGAALYAPLRVLLREDDEGNGVFEYDLPSSFFGQFGDEQVTAVGRMLDEYLDAALSKAAEQQPAA